MLIKRLLFLKAITKTSSSHAVYAGGPLGSSSTAVDLPPAASMKYLIFPVARMPSLLLHSDLSFQCIFSSPFPPFGAVLPLLHWCGQEARTAARHGELEAPVLCTTVLIFKLFPFPKVHMISILCSSMSTY